MIRALCILAALVAPALADDAPPIAIHAEATPDSTTIGTRIRYEVTVTAPAGVEIAVAQPSEHIGDMDIVDFGVEKPAPAPDGHVVFTRWWQLVAWSPGHHLLQSPEVRYRSAGGELQTAQAADVGVTVESVLERAGDVADIRDVKPPEAIPIDWRPYYAIAGGLAVLALLVALAYRFVVGPKRAAPAVPPPPAHVVALAALDALRARGLVERGAMKDFYSALSDIVRRYLEDRFRLRAPEMTTEEFLLVTSRDGRLAAGHRRLLGDFLTESDLVKFARHVPTLSDGERAFEAARRFVTDTTAPEEVAA